MTRLEIGDVLEDRYRIDRPIARGGMSTVYRCVDMRLGRQVAAKVMDERYDDDPIFIKRFSREARAMARLQHPNLVAIHDFSADGEPVYLIMELIDGGTLRELLAEGGPLTVPAALSTLRSVLQGLTEVHSTGLIHRDIKPDNVLITSHHRVKLGDFGLVRATNAQATSNMIVGTVSYLAPEQVTGEDITPATDVYSAGIVLFELLTGTVPFSGDTPIAHATARLYDDVPAPSTRAEGVPKLVDALMDGFVVNAKELTGMPDDTLADWTAAHVRIIHGDEVADACGVADSVMRPILQMEAPLVQERFDLLRQDSEALEAEIQKNEEAVRQMLTRDATYMKQDEGIKMKDGSVVAAS